ncbi:ATP-binding cassette domain-containing protein [bacterium]|nr:ATP-binding cassette domain-containing protein [bacterium]
MIRINNLTYRYPGSSSDALKGVCCDLKSAEVTALMGANGSGKTTLIRCLNGLIQPSSGSVTVDGLEIQNSKMLYEIRRKVGMVFQNPDNQIVATTVEREIAFGLENLGLPVDQMHSIVNDMLYQFSLEQYRHTAPHLLSGGERQRLALAAVCAMEPDYLILDEPTSLLDPQGRKDIFQYIMQHRDSGMGVILVTQFAEEALLCDRLIVLNNGYLVLDDAPHTVFSKRDKVQEFGIPVPVSFALEAIIQDVQCAN